MQLLMLSSDRALLDPHSGVSTRLKQYSGMVDHLTVVLAGSGHSHEETRGNMHIVFPGGTNLAHNFFKLLRMRIPRADLVSAQDPFFIGLIGLVWSRRRSVPLQLQVHTDLTNPAFIFESPRHFVQFCIACVTLPFATQVRVVSERIARSVRSYTKAPVVLLPIYTDHSRFETKQPRPRLFGLDHPCIITVSRLTHEKRIGTVVRALARVPHAHLYILGSGAERVRLESLVTSLSLSERVHFVGWIDDTTAYYQHADCFVQNSLYEGYGVSLVDALAAGTPVVTTDVGVASELPVGAVTITTGEEYDLARAITDTLARPQAGRDDFLERHMSESQYLSEMKRGWDSCVS